MLRLDGVICPIITPFAKDGSLDEDALKTHVEFLIDNGVHGIFPLGTAGEFALLSARERRRVVEVTAEATQGRVPVLAGVSDPGSGNAAEYARAAEKAGADAVVATPPYYYAVDARGVQAHFETIADAVEIPLILYNIPSWTHVSVPADVVLKLAENNYVVAMKHTTNDLASFASYLQLLKGKIAMLIGADALIASALNLGADGAVVGCANVIPRETVNIYENHARNDQAASLEAQRRIWSFTSVMMLGTFPAALKEGLRILRRNVGDVRKPLTPLSKQEADQVKKALQTMKLVP